MAHSRKTSRADRPRQAAAVEGRPLRVPDVPDHWHDRRRVWSTSPVRSRQFFYGYRIPVPVRG